MRPSFCEAVSSPGLKPQMPSRTRAALMRLMILVRSPHQDFALAAGTPGVFFLERGDRQHFAVTRCSPRSHPRNTRMSISVSSPIRLGSANFARYRDARRMHDEGLDATGPTSHRASQNPSRPDFPARTVRVIALPAFVARSRQPSTKCNSAVGSGSSFFSGRRSIPGTTPAASQLD